jgi:signal transduction histidine kinase
MQLLEICDTSCGFLLSLVNDSLDYAQMEAGKFKIVYQDVVVRDLVSQVYKMLDVQLALKPNVKLSFEVSEDVPEIIQSDFQRLK